VHSQQILIFLHFAHEVYLHIQLGNKALDRACPTEAADHFTAAVNAGTFLSKSASNPKYEEFVVVCTALCDLQCFLCSIRDLCSSLDVTLRPCGKLQTRDGATLSSGQVNSQKSSKRTDI
jgi:hypothetical protein